MLSRRIVVIALALVFAANLALPSGVTNTVATTGTGSRSVTTYAYTVAATENESITEFHVEPPMPNGKVDGTPGGPTIPPPPGAPAGTPPTPLSGWTATRSGGAVNWKASNPATPITAATGPVTFTITIPTGELHDGLVKWHTTNGNDGTVDSGPELNEPSTHGPHAFVGVGPSAAPTGVVTTIRISSTEPSRPYALFAVSNASDEVPDSFDNHAGFLAWVKQHPVAPEWGLSFENMSGTLSTPRAVPARRT